jgi:N-acetyl sugar amidotransferase
MDTSDPLIKFDSGGRCNHCTDFLEVRSKYRLSGEEGRRELNRLAARMRRAGKRKPYDCVLGISGGVDSTYAAYIMTELGVRPLAVHMDNGWDTEESVSNIRNLTAALGIDYESFVLDWEEFRQLQVAFLRASVPEAETPTDVAIPASLHDVAARHQIKYIVSAGNLTTEGILPKAWHYNAKDRKYFDHINQTFGSGQLQRFPTFDYKREALMKLFHGISVVYPMNCVDFDQRSAVELLVTRFGYKPSGEKHHESRYTRFIQSYYLYQKFGIDYRRARFSSEICCGTMDRAEAVEILKDPPYEPDVIEREKPYIAKKLKLSIDELESIISAEPKWYWQYPNDERKLSIIYGIYRWLFNKGKLVSY